MVSAYVAYPSNLRRALAAFAQDDNRGRGVIEAAFRIGL